MVLYFGEAYILIKIIPNEVFLCSMKDANVENFCPNFHIIPIIFKVLVELAIHSG